MRRLDSAHSHWLFDEDAGRFRRVPRGTDIDAPTVEWTPYHALEFDLDSGSFVVTLDADGTQRLRSWILAPDEEVVTDAPTTELRVELVDES